MSDSGPTVVRQWSDSSDSSDSQGSGGELFAKKTKATHTAYGLQAFVYTLYRGVRSESSVCTALTEHYTILKSCISISAQARRIPMRLPVAGSPMAGSSHSISGEGGHCVVHVTGRQFTVYIRAVQSPAWSPGTDDQGASAKSRYIQTQSVSGICGILSPVPSRCGFCAPHVDQPSRASIALQPPSRHLQSRSSKTPPQGCSRRLTV